LKWVVPKLFHPSKMHKYIESSERGWQLIDILLCEDEISNEEYGR